MKYPHTINELVQKIYEHNDGHFDFHDNMGGEDCECDLHNAIKIIMKYWEGEEE